MSDFRAIRTAMIVGGTSGVGLHVARRMLAGGAGQVLITGTDRELAGHVAEQLDPSGRRVSRAGLRIGWDQQALEDFDYAWGQCRTRWDLVLFAAGHLAGHEGEQLAEAEGLCYLLGKAVDAWACDGGVVGVITSTLTDTGVPGGLRRLDAWVQGKRMLATRAADLGRRNTGVTVLDFAFSHVRGTQQWVDAPELEPHFHGLERADGYTLNAQQAAVFTAYYMRGRHVSGRLSPSQPITRQEARR